MENNTPAPVYNWPVLTLEENAALQVIYAHCGTIPQPNFADNIIAGAEALIPIAQLGDNFNAAIVFLSACVPNTAHLLQQKLNTLSDITNKPITTITEAYQQLTFQELMGDNYVPEVETKPVVKPAPVDNSNIPDVTKPKKDKQYHNKLDNYRRRRETLAILDQEYKDQKEAYRQEAQALADQLKELKEHQAEQLRELKAQHDEIKRIHADNWTADMYRV